MLEKRSQGSHGGRGIKGSIQFPNSHEPRIRQDELENDLSYRRSMGSTANKINHKLHHNLLIFKMLLKKTFTGDQSQNHKKNTKGYLQLKMDQTLP